MTTPAAPTTPTPDLAESFGDPCTCRAYYLARFPDLGSEADGAHRTECANTYRQGRKPRHGARNTR